MSDPGKYRRKEEVEEMMKSDPVLVWGRRLVEQERFRKEDLEAADKEILALMDDAVEFVEQSPDPPVETLYEDVYVRSPYIHMKVAEKDPAWRAAEREDRVPEKYPPFDYAAWLLAHPAPEAPPETPAATPAAAKANAAEGEKAEKLAGPPTPIAPGADAQASSGPPAVDRRRPAPTMASGQAQTTSTAPPASPSPKDAGEKVGR
jgi:hypothetical protein